MKKNILILFILLSGLKSFGQKEMTSYIGTNLFQLPTSTINLNYSIDLEPNFTPFVDLGYTLNYKGVLSFDIIGHFLTPHIKCVDEYRIDKQSGGYLKIGGFVNLRNDFRKKNFFHLGLFLTNTLVYEKGTYTPMLDTSPDAIPSDVEHSVYLYGISSLVGYEFNITERLKAAFDFQVSFPTNKYLDLYGYRNFIPGMGFKDINEKWFPMLILNIKYRL